MVVDDDLALGVVLAVQTAGIPTAKLPEIATFRDWLLSEAASDETQLKRLGR